MAPLLGSEEAGIGSIPTAAGPDSPGAGPPAATLAKVYAAGASSPATDDLMAMQFGTALRFQANTDANPLPLVGIYETAASKTQPLATSGYPSFGQSLAVDLGIHVGGRFFNWFEMFDPAWGGDPAQLDDYTWSVETISFQANPATAWRRNNGYAQRDYTAIKNYQPEATPAGPPGVGPTTFLHRLWLYNSDDLGLQLVDEIDGFGQDRRQVSPIQNGVIYEQSTHYSSRLIGPAANDGVGWAVFDGNISHGGPTPRAALSARMVGATPAGDWYWALSLQDTGGSTVLQDVATFSRSGVTFNVPINPSGSAVPQAYVTPLIDFMVPNQLVAFNTPTITGKRFIVTGGRLVLNTRDAALTTAPVLNVAQNGVDLFSVTASTTNINIIPAPELISVLPTTVPTPDMSTLTLQLHVSTAGAGAGLTSLTGYYVLLGVYV